MKKEDSMGDGKNLKKYLDEKGTNVRKIAKATGISLAVPKRCQKETPANICYSQE